MNDGLQEKKERAAGEMHKRREKMADAKRYIIYYTFGENSRKPAENIRENEVKENV